MHTFTTLDPVFTRYSLFHKLGYIVDLSSRNKTTTANKNDL